jgi:hypothetical protein
MESHKLQEESNKLGINLDPWDNYLYHDSKIFLEFIFNKNSKSIRENFISMKFLLFVFYNDFLSNFKIDGKILNDKLIEFIKTNDGVYEFVDKTVVRKIEPTEEEIDKFENRLEVVFDLFLQKLTESRHFSDKKNDYFNA